MGHVSKAAVLFYLRLERCMTEFDNGFKPGLNQVRLDMRRETHHMDPTFSKDTVIADTLQRYRELEGPRDADGRNQNL